MIRSGRRCVLVDVIIHRRRRSIALTSVTVCVTLALTACGSSGGSATSHTTAASTTSSASSAAAPATGGAVQKGAKSVRISGYAFHPTALTVAAGTKVTFANHDQTAHTATQKGGGFDTGTINPGGHATVTFTKPGTYTYYCQFHAFMRATITVK